MVEEPVTSDLSVVVVAFVVDNTFGFALVALVVYKAGLRVVVRAVVVTFDIILVVVDLIGALVVAVILCDFILNCVIGEIVVTLLVVYGTFVVVKVFGLPSGGRFVTFVVVVGFVLCVIGVLTVVVGFRVVVVAL